MLVIVFTLHDQDIITESGINIVRNNVWTGWQLLVNYFWPIHFHFNKAWYCYLI